jgi:hypothetical protein
MPIDGSGLCMIIELGYFVNVHRVLGSCWVCAALSFEKESCTYYCKNFLVMRCLDVKEYHLGCHKYNFVVHSNQKSFRLLLNYQNIMRMKDQIIYVHTNG